MSRMLIMGTNVKEVHDKLQEYIRMLEFTPFPKTIFVECSMILDFESSQSQKTKQDRIIQK